MKKIENDVTLYVSPLCEYTDLVIEGVLCESEFGHDSFTEKNDWEFN